MFDYAPRINSNKWYHDQGCEVWEAVELMRLIWYADFVHHDDRVSTQEAAVGAIRSINGIGVDKARTDRYGN